MERINVHTLLKVRKPENMILKSSADDWVEEVMKKSTYVIVRRGEQEKSIPVGIRGFNKSQRMAAVIDFNNWSKKFTPQDAVNTFKQTNNARFSLPAFQLLGKLIPILSSYDWGVGGSLEYELATGLETVTENSDVDIIMTRPIHKMSVLEAKELVNELHSISPVHADIQIVKDDIGFSLEEYAQDRNNEIMVKTNQGPKLVYDPWEL